MSKSAVRRTYLGDLLIFVTVVLLGSCSTTDFASLQPQDGVEVATGDVAWPSQRPRRAFYGCRAHLQRKSAAAQARLDVSTGETNEIFQIPDFAGGLLVVCSPFNKVSAPTHLQCAGVDLDPKVERVRYPNLTIVVRWLNGLILRRCLPNLSQTDRPSKPVRIACLWRLTMRV